MTSYKIVSTFLNICLSLLICQSALAHKGSFDGQGGHYTRKTGEYHFHRGGGAAQPVQSLQTVAQRKEKDIEAVTRRKSAFRIVASENESKINGYFREANENVGALNCDLMIRARDVDRQVMNRIKRRDGHRCIICGSTDKLEVDHRRALMNGGTNDESNLFTLCDKCHTVKTKYDNSLKKKRNRICRTHAFLPEALSPVPVKPVPMPATTSSGARSSHYLNLIKSAAIAQM